MNIVIALLATFAPVHHATPPPPPPPVAVATTTTTTAPAPPPPTAQPVAPPPAPPANMTPTPAGTVLSNVECVVVLGAPNDATFSPGPVGADGTCSAYWAQYPTAVSITPKSETASMAYQP